MLARMSKSATAVVSGRLGAGVGRLDPVAVGRDGRGLRRSAQVRGAQVREVRVMLGEGSACQSNPET